MIKFTEVPKRFYPTRTGFRDNTPCFPMDLNFIFINGGMGDYITWLTAIEWLASEATWIRGNLICPVYLLEIAEHVLKPYPEWGVKSYKHINELPSPDATPFRGPVELNRESLNATGAHLSTCGWVYFCNKEKAPEGWDRYPYLEQEHLDTVALPEEAKPLKPGSYAIITTGITTNSRKIPGEYWNHIIEHVVARGLRPVFLGKSVVETGNASNIKTSFSHRVRYDLGLDLRDKTSLMQAAAIMSKAAAVIGHDNGLLHLAGCVPRVPIVFGYNLASPEHREPKRKDKAPIFNVTLTPQELACIHCQSNTNFLIGYNFRECFYGDLACMPKLFEKEGARWKAQIDKAIGHTE